MIYIFWLIESRSEPQSLSENCMSYPSPPPPPPPPPPPSSIIPLSFPVSNVGSFMPQGPVDNKHSDSQSQYVHAPLIMRPCNFDNHPSNSSPFPSINPRMSQPNIFYKTRKCVKFEKGNCLIAENCNYAHGDEDIREPPPNWRELICEKDKGVGNQNDDQRMTNSGKVCWTFNKGKWCKYGEKCRYLHESPSKVKTGMANPLARECSAIHIGTMGPMMEHRRETKKTKLNMCRMWEITGQCPFGERCHFAHVQSGMLVAY